MTPDEAVIETAAKIVDRELDRLLDYLLAETMTDHPCPHPGLPGSMIERGPERGMCAYPAELMLPDAWPPFWRCPIHGTIEEWRP
jgi:hypothetical protein